MDWKNLLNLNSHEWWRNHRKMVTYGGFLIIFGVYLSPIVQGARNKNQCLRLVSKAVIASGTQVESGLSLKEMAFINGYQICNHKS